MTSLKEELTSLALDSGAIRARVTIKERLDGPPSADPTSVLPGARSVARVAAALACGGELDGLRLLTLATIEKAIEEQCYGPDLVLAVPIRFGLGYGLTSKEFPIGPNPRTFFWGGWGGSVITVDLDARLSFAYVMNKMRTGLTGDPRSARLSMALYASLRQVAGRETRDIIF